MLDVLKSLAGIEQWDYSDRRGSLRIPCHLKGRLEKGDSTTDVEITDISLVGIRALVLGKLRKGSTVELKPRKKKGKAKPVKCRVEWKVKQDDGWLAGLSFKDSEDTMSQSWLFQEIVAIGKEAVKTQQRREGVRVMCTAPAKLKVASDLRDAQLRDLGFGGALLECPGEQWGAGQKVRLDFGPIGDLSRVVINSEVVVSHKQKTPRYGLKFLTFHTGGVTDLERYINYFYELNEAED